MSRDITLHIHAIEATGLPKSTSLFGNSSVYLSVKVDERKLGKSNTVDISPSARFDYRLDVACSASEQLVLEVKRGGMMGVTSLGGCSLAVADISRMDGVWLPLYSYDSRPQEIGKILVSIERQDSARPAPMGFAGGLQNLAGTTEFGQAQASPRESPRPTLTTMGTWGATAEPAMPIHSAAGGLCNYAGVAAGDMPNYTARLSNASGTSGGGGLVNYAGDVPADSVLRPSGTKLSLERQGTAGLANLAATRDDGKRTTALPRVKELLEALVPFSPTDDEQRTKLQQALEELRRVPDADLRTPAGKGAYATCSELISAVFEHAMARHDKKEMDGGLWLAGRLPTSEDDVRASLQDKLRQRWSKVQMDDAFAQANSSLPTAIRTAEALEALMDALDLAEFHANFAGVDPSRAVSQILAQLKPQLQSRLENLLRGGDARGAEQAENFFGILGAARIDSLGLRSLQQDLQRLQGLDLLRSALQPLPSQVGFPPLKDRQLRHATTVARTAIADDPSGRTLAAVRALLLQEMMPTCMGHSNESVLALLRTAFHVQLTAAEVWTAAKGPYDRLPADRKQQMPNQLKGKCAEWGQEPPDWLLSPEQASCQQVLRNALRGGNPNELQAACQKVMETSGGREVCQEDMRKAVTRLQQMYRLPEGWSVESMLSGSANLLHKVALDQSIVQLFDRLLKETTEATVRTRDRRGAVPQAYTAVKAIEVRNAANWQTYTNRRDEIAQECRKINARTDVNHWRDNLNGLVATAGICGKIAEMTTQPPLMREANEVWMIHGTNPAAADGISSSDFDMARASPTGLFGAGIYFAESVSKSDEYTQSKTEGGREIFPLLICRVCLGYVYYCDERAPDRRQLEARCLRQQWHSVLGDRKKTSGTFREFIVYDNLQAFPAYIVYYTRQY